jgi:hypothetical protein
MRFFLAALLSATLLLAADKPNFSGTWKMNAEKTDYGKIPKPQNFERKIEQKDPELNVTATFTGQNGPVTTNFKHYTDGRESVNNIRGSEIRTKATWDGNTLVLDSVRKVQNADVTTHEKWSLSEDGKELTISSKTVAPNGDLIITMVMDKQ